MATGKEKPAAINHALESGADFLSRLNFKSLSEFLTAEVILNRPGDPVAFLRDVLDEKIQERNGKPFSPSDSVQYLKTCYRQASEAANDEGEIQPLPVPRKPSTVGNILEMKERLVLLEKVIKSSVLIAQELDPFQATECIIKQTCSVLSCERATVFRIDEEKNELCLVIAQGAEEIRLPIGQGIAGSVAVTGMIANIGNPYEDSRFNSEHDENSGFVSRSILAAPIVDGSKQVIGVIEAVNKIFPSTSEGNEILMYGKSEQKAEGFSQQDEQVLEFLAGQAGISLRNAKLYHDLIASDEKNRSLVDILRTLNNIDLGVNSLLFTITQRAHHLVSADRCSMFVVDRKSEELLSIQGEVNLRLPWSKGIAGECFLKNIPINIPDAYEDARFNQEVDAKYNYRTKSILSMPCRSGKSKEDVVGVIQLINKQGNAAFDEQDMEIMSIFLDLAGPIIAQSNFFNSEDPKGNDGNEAQGMKRKLPRSSSLRQAPTISEDDEENKDGC